MLAIASVHARADPDDDRWRANLLSGPLPRLADGSGRFRGNATESETRSLGGGLY